MLHEKNLPKQFWVEAANTIVFLQNRLLTRVVEHTTPFEAWYGFKPSLNFLKVFGCLCYTHVPHVQRDKLDERAELGIFIGYSSIAKAYKVYQPHHRKFVISRDVHFVENEEWNCAERKLGGHDQKLIDFTTANQELENWEADMIDDKPVRGTRSLEDIYQRCNVVVCEPSNYEKAKLSQEWKAAMQEEFNMIEKNQTWKLVQRPQDRKVIGVKWVYRTKLNANRLVNKHKARLVVKGFAQIPGIDYIDTFAPVVRLDVIRLLLAIAAQLSWKVYQLDVKSAFLNGYLQEEIFVEQS